ncbi:unnamed protein product [Ceutorhynchus assimilis]|uniref:RNA polymerase II-associated protein 1 n=1 Tax=Ceutorhynchus assimilis TaxID=467358 RepID=A0A9N9QQL2_9CUCU|nr:unnamed protein product [Ceutorhynchus assimilis]
MYKLGNNKDNEEDEDQEMLNQEAEFYKQKALNKLIPAATAVKSNKDVHQTPKSTKNDLEKMEIEPTGENIQDQLANTFEAIPKGMDLSPIKENVQNYNKTSITYDPNGFPKPVRRNTDIKPLKGSIFSQHMKRLKKNSEVVTTTENKTDVNKSIFSLQGKKENEQTRLNAHTPAILSTTERLQIHEENLETLNHMNQEEILANKKQLLSSLDPALIQFLRDRQSLKQKEIESGYKTNTKQNITAENLGVEQVEVLQEMLSMPESNGWLNFNKFEANKLAWMQDMPIPKLKQTEGFEARFDFDGYLLPWCVAEINEANRYLYHHGDEPERPGYSLQELLSLSRSNVMQQRIMALNTLANILSIEQTGVYEKVFDLPIEQIFFVLRVALDDNTPSVLAAAAKALRNLVYFQIDETCLDNMLGFGMGFVQPILAIDSAMEDDITVNDQQLAETNLVKCLIRSGILTRIRYIVNTIKPHTETIIHCIEILIRLARDSEFIINKILQCEGLIGSLIKYFLPPFKSLGLDKSCPGYFMPLPHIIKLLRVLSSRNRNIAASLLNKYDLLIIMMSYLNEDHFSQNAFAMRLQVESMYYWTVVLHYGLSIDSLSQHSNIILKFLDYHFKNTNNDMSTTLIRQSHVTALFMLLTKAVEKEHVLFQSLTTQCFEKWMSQFRILQEFKCAHSQITTSILYYAAVCNRNGVNINGSGLFELIFDSDGFKFATNNILNGSILLNNFQTHQTTANLKSLEAAAWFSMDHIIPVMQTNSCIPFLYALTSFIMSSDSSKLKTKFLNYPNIKMYTEKLKSSKSYYNIGNWFARCESFLIMNILKIVVNIQADIDPASYYDTAVKCLCVFSTEQKQDMKFLLDNMVFCPRFYPVEVAMSNTQINERNTELDRAWSNLDEIKKVYANVLGITGNLITFDSSLCLDTSIGNVIPVDWIYTPLVVLYSNYQKRSKNEVHNEQEDFQIVINCLRWVLIYETHFETLSNCISPAEKYVRLGCLFLASDNLFLHAELQDLMTQVYGFLIRDEKMIDFKKQISGLTSFKDFFMQLLDQYQAVSYGNKVFGNVLLFPLVKRHDVGFRKALWSEYLAVVQSFNLSADEVWIHPCDLIKPEDTDMSLCTSYYRAWATNIIPKNSIMHEIASKNIEFFKRRMEKDSKSANIGDL